MFIQENKKVSLEKKKEVQKNKSARINVKKFRIYTNRLTSTFYVHLGQVEMVFKTTILKPTVCP